MRHVILPLVLLALLLIHTGCEPASLKEKRQQGMSATLSERLSSPLRPRNISEKPTASSPRSAAPRFNISGLAATWNGMPEWKQAGLAGHRKSQEPVRAIYVTGHIVSSKRMGRLIQLVKQTELNAMVIDVNQAFSRSKQPSGAIAAVPNAAAIPLQRTVGELKRNGIYKIARVIVFKDPALAQAKPDWALQARTGGVWRDKSGTAWIDPYCKEAWQYPVKLAVSAARMGFDEIQFDYVRFPENERKVNREVRFQNREGIGKNEAIRRFLHQASTSLHREGAGVSVDVFGLVGSPGPDMGIGQSWRSIATEVDYISPMVYPSHYAAGTWGVKQPDLMPGQIVVHALQDAVRQNHRLHASGYRTAEVRPWLQGFTARWIHPHQRYGSEQIQEQVLAAREAGIQSYMIWNASSRYEDPAK